MWGNRAADQGGFMILASPSNRFVFASCCAAFLLLAATPASAQQSRSGNPQTRSSQPRPAAATPQRPPAQRSTPAKPAAGPVGKPAAPPAGKATAPAAGPATGPGGASASLVASFDDWGVYTAQAGRSKICYALSQPKDRLPKGVSRDPAYFFVSFRPADNVTNEVALVLGFRTKEDGQAAAAIGTTSYALLPKEQNAWLKDPAQEGPAIASMMRGSDLVVKVQSQRGAQLTDRYSLNGFSKAVERARRECS
jgi:hypothetical protein